MVNKKKKLLTIEDLVKFCESNQLNTFNSKDSGYQLCVQVPAIFKKKESEVEDDTLLYCILKTCHIGLNRNGSYISEESMKEAMPTLKYKPILCNFTDTDNGKDFTSHDMEIDEDGNIIYIERQVGCFTADEPYLEYDKDNDKTYVMAYAAIPRDYTEAADIIERKNGTKVSVELNINEMSYNGKEKYLQLDSFVFAGCTLLGVDPDTGTEVGEGMKGARLDIADFSVENNSVQFSTNEELLNEIKKLNENLSYFNINQAENSVEKHLEEGGNKTVAKFEELLEKYGKTVEDITFEYENLSDEELEAKFAEVFEESTDGEGEADPEPTSDGDEGEGLIDGNIGEDNEGSEDSEVVVEIEPEAEPENDPEPDVDPESEPEQFSEKLVRTYEISHDDIRYALYNLLAAFEDADNEWYFINSVYDNYFTYENWNGDKIYGQAYTKNDDNVAFDGERWNLHRELLNDSEYAELMSMRANYASLEQFKTDVENAQIKAEKESILYNEKYSVISEKDENNNYKNEAYAKLVSEMDNYSLTELEKELKTIFADYITNGGQFAYVNEEKPIVNKKLFSTSTSKKSSRYGNLFNK